MYLIKLLKNCDIGWSLLFCCYLGLTACGESRSNSNTPEHKAEHGYKEGYTTELRVGKSLLRIPPEAHFNPTTSGRIIPGQAEEVALSLRFPQFDESPRFGAVRIFLQGDGYENPEIWDTHLEREAWREIIKSDELELWEYHRQKGYDGSWGYISYLAANDFDRTPKGSLIRYRCNGYPNRYVIQCQGSFVLEDDLWVKYFIHGRVMSHWRAIHHEVVSDVEKLIVK